MRLDAERFLTNIAGYTQAIGEQQRRLRLATIDSEYTAEEYQQGIGPRVVFDGEVEPTRKRWPVLGVYWPAPGDRVLMLPVGHGWVVAGPIGQSTSTYVLGLAPGRIVFKAFLKTTQSISNDASPQAANALAWTDVDHDPYTGWVSTVPTRWAAPYTGWYTLSGMVGLAGSSGGTVRGACWFVNGSGADGGLGREVAGSWSATYTTVVAPTLPVLLEAGDYVELVAVQNSGGSLNTTSSGIGASYMAATYGGPP